MDIFILNRPTYWLTRFLILRLLGAIYAVAFLAAINQIIPLIGSDGLASGREHSCNVPAKSSARRAPDSLYTCHRSFGSSTPDTALLVAAWITGFALFPAS